MTDIFAVQDEVTRQIVGALKVTLSPAEAALLAEDATKDVDAHDGFLRGRELLFGSVKTREIFAQANAFFRQAIERDPAYAEAYAALSVLYFFDYQNRWSEDPDRSLTEAVQLAEQAVEKNANEPFARYASAIAATFAGNLERARVEAEAALALNPNFAPAYNQRGAVHILSGEPLSSIPYIERAMRLDPAFSQQYLHFLGLAYLFAGKYATAVAYFRERIVLVPETDFSRSFLAAALGHLGEVDDARRVWHELKAINPKYSFDEHVGRLPFRNQADVDKIKEGLEKAGLPD